MYGPFMVRFGVALPLRLDLLSKAAQGLGWGAARPAGRAAEDGPVRRGPVRRDRWSAPEPHGDAIGALGS